MLPLMREYPPLLDFMCRPSEPGPTAEDAGVACRGLGQALTALQESSQYSEFVDATDNDGAFTQSFDLHLLHPDDSQVRV